MKRALALALLVLAGPAVAAPRSGAPFRVAAFDSLRHFDANRLDLPTTNFGTLAIDLISFESAHEFPRGSGKTVVFDAGLWVGAKVGGQVRVTVAEYSSEWRPGRVFGVVPEPPLAAYLRNWKVRPAVGVRFLSGPAGATAGAFNKYIGGNEPATATASYDLMRGLHLDGSEWIDPTTSQPTHFPLSGDPVTGTGFLDSFPADRRLLVSAGPFDLAVGDSAEFVFALVVGGGVDRLDSIERLRCEAQLAGTSALLGFAPVFPAHVRLAWASPNAVVILWSAEGAVPRALEVRRHDGPIVAPWPLDAESRGFLYPDGSGNLSYTGSALPSGVQATYGLFEPCDPLEPLSQVALTGLGGELAFHVLSPSSGRELELSLHLPMDEPVRLEAFSVDGRRRLDRDLGTLGHGALKVVVPVEARWPRGLYFPRLTQAFVVRTARVIVVD